jgi:hypothetical protein
MARENARFTFTFAPDGAGCVVAIAGHDEPVSFSFAGYSGPIRLKLLEHGFKQIMSDVGAATKAKALTPAMLAAGMRARHAAFCHGMWTMKDAGWDFYDLTSAIMATRGLTETERERVERFLLAMDETTREALRRRKDITLAIAEAKVARLAALPDGPTDTDGPDPLAGL